MISGIIDRKFTLKPMHEKGADVKLIYLKSLKKV